MKFMENLDQYVSKINDYKDQDNYSLKNQYKYIETLNKELKAI